MTGEMHSIKQDGHDSNGDEWPIHAAIAKALEAELRPFDVYQGPYILTERGRLWLCSKDGYEATIYNSNRDIESEPFAVDDELAAIAAAESVTRQKTGG